MDFILEMLDFIASPAARPIISKPIGLVLAIKFIIFSIKQQYTNSRKQHKYIHIYKYAPPSNAFEYLLFYTEKGFNRHFQLKPSSVSLEQKSFFNKKPHQIVIRIL